MSEVNNEAVQEVKSLSTQEVKREPQAQDPKPTEQHTQRVRLGPVKTTGATKPSMIESPKGVNEKFDDGYAVVDNGIAMIKAWRVRIQMELLRLGSGIGEQKEDDKENIKRYLFAVGDELALAVDLIAKLEQAVSFTSRQIGGMISSNENLLSFFSPEGTSEEESKKITKLVSLGLEKGGPVWSTMKESLEGKGFKVEEKQYGLSIDQIVSKIKEECSQKITLDDIRHLITEQMEKKENDLLEIVSKIQENKGDENFIKNISQLISEKEHEFIDIVTEIKEKQSESISLNDIRDLISEQMEKKEKEFLNIVAEINEKQDKSISLDDIRTLISENMKEKEEGLRLLIEKKFANSEAEKKNLSSEIEKIVQNTMLSLIKKVQVAPQNPVPVRPVPTEQVNPVETRDSALDAALQAQEQTEMQEKQAAFEQKMTEQTNFLSQSGPIPDFAQTTPQTSIPEPEPAAPSSSADRKQEIDI